MNKIFLAFMLLGVFFVNNSYSMLNSSTGSQYSNVISWGNVVLGALSNLSIEDKESLENTLIDEGLLKEFCNDFIISGKIGKNPLGWEQDK